MRGAVFLGLLLSACASGPPPVPLPPVVEVPDPAVVPARRGDALRPPSALAGRAEVADADGTRVLAVTRVPAAGERWWYRVDTWYAALLVYDGDGGVALAEERDLPGDVRLVYEPPLPLLPARVVIGGRSSHEVAVVVYRLGSGAERTRGRCRVDISVVGPVRRETPAGAFDCLRVVSKRELSMRWASSSVEVTCDLAPGVGVVAERIARRDRLLGLLPSTDRKRFSLVALEGE